MTEEQIAAIADEVHLVRTRLEDMRMAVLAHIEVLTLQLVDVKHTLNNVSAHLTRTEVQMALDAATMQAQLAAASDQLAANFTVIHDQLVSALAGTAAASDAAVQNALAGFAPMIDHLTQMGIDEVNPVPPVAPIDVPPVGP